MGFFILGIFLILFAVLFFGMIAKDNNDDDFILTIGVFSMLIAIIGTGVVMYNAELCDNSVTEYNRYLAKEIVEYSNYDKNQILEFMEIAEDNEMTTIEIISYLCPELTKEEVAAIEISINATYNKARE